MFNNSSSNGYNQNLDLHVLKKLKIIYIYASKKLKIYTQYLFNIFKNMQIYIYFKKNILLCEKYIKYNKKKHNITKKILNNKN